MISCMLWMKSSLHLVCLRKNSKQSFKMVSFISMPTSRYEAALSAPLSCLQNHWYSVLGADSFLAPYDSLSSRTANSSLSKSKSPRAPHSSPCSYTALLAQAKPHSQQQLRKPPSSPSSNSFPPTVWLGCLKRKRSLPSARSSLTVTKVR